MPPQVTHLRRRLTHIDAPAALGQLNANEFEGYASLFGVPDNAGDVVAPGAFAKSLRARGIGEVRMLYQHFAHEPIGVWEQIKEDARGLYAPGDIALFRMSSRGAARHCGIIAAKESQPTLIHARQNKRVSEEPFSALWRAKLAFAFRL